MQNSIVPVAKDDKVQIAGIFRAHFNETEGNFAFIAYNNNPAIQFVELSSANSGFVLDDNQTHHSKIRTTHRMPTVSEINDFSCSAKPPYTVHSLACVFTATLKNGDMAVCAFVQPLLDQNAEQGARDNLSLVCGNATGIIDGNDHIAHVSSFPNAIQGMQKGDTFIPNDRFYNNILVVLHRYLEDQNLSLFSLLGIDQYTGSLLFNLHLNNDTSSYQWIPLFCGNTNENLISELIDTSNTSSVSSVKLKISGVGLVKGAREIIIPKDRLILSKNGNAIILRTNSSNIVESLNCLPSSNPYYSFFVIPALALLSLSLYGAYKYKTKNNDQNISLLETVVEHLTPCMNKNSTSISNNTNKRLDCNKPKYHCDNVTSIHYQPVPSTTVLKLSKACIISNDHFHKIKLHYLGADEYSVYGLNVETKHPEDKIPLPVDLIKALSKKQRKLFSETLQKYISEHGSTDDHYQEASRLATKEIISETGEDSVYVDIVAEPAPNTSTFQYEHGSADDHYQEASTKDVVAEPAPNTSTFQYEHGSTDDHYQEASRLATKEIICETGEDSVDASIIAESAPNTSTFQSNASIHPSFGRAAVTSL
ncbi:hypothetical protein CAXC1_300037 [Candidatus Xenohaliotis californiensis]|uniref:Uncharacterized protein n=2 Tax=Candidatus Xenohaliotis californiensis TaxID=84677 RepID=A0ABP0ET44_9RICK|nr:hypothetical protein CAXC1_300037 [Candidatus Xenohaliotis californiensis]